MNKSTFAISDQPTRGRLLKNIKTIIFAEDGEINYKDRTKYMRQRLYVDKA